MRKKLAAVVILTGALIAVGAGNGFAATVTWNGLGGNSNWNNGANWTGGIPAATDDAVIPSVVANQPHVDAGTGTCLNLILDTTLGPVTLTLDGDFSHNAGGGTITVIGGNAATITGVANIVETGATVITNNSTGLFTISCNQIQCSGATLTTFAGTGSTTVSAVILEGLVSPVTKNGNGTLRFGGANTYSGATNVNTGTLLINAAQGAGCTGAVTVASGASLGGTGTIVGPVTVNNGGFLRPGDGGVGILTAGTVTFNAGSNLLVDIVNLTKDVLAVNTLNVAATAVIGLEAGAVWQANPYNVVTATTYNSGAGVFTTNFPAGWSIVSTTNSGIQINGAAIIPTLTEWGLILFAMLMATFAIWRIRQRKLRTA
jgi:autotransporter-associated beta strand protein